MVGSDFEDGNLERAGLGWVCYRTKLQWTAILRKGTGTDLELINILSMPSTLRRLHVATVNQASLVVSREREFLFMSWSAKLLQFFHSKFRDTFRFLDFIKVESCIFIIR